MNNPDQIEDEIVTLLGPALAPMGATAMPWPDTDDEYDTPWKNGRALVMYHGSKYEADEDSIYKRVRSMGTPVQDQVFDIVIGVESRNRRGAAGNHAILRELKKALHGRTLAGGFTLYLVDDASEGRQQGIWTHMITFRSRSMAVPVITEDEETAAPLQSVTFNPA